MFSHSAGSISLCLGIYRPQMNKPGGSLWGFVPARLCPHCCQYLQGGERRYAEPCLGPKGLSCCGAGREVSGPSRVSEEQCQGQEKDTSPVQTSTRCRQTNLASGDDGGYGETAVLPRPAAVGSWGFPCQAKTIFVWVSGGRGAALSPSPVQGSRDLLWGWGGGSLWGAGDLRSMGSEDASSIMHWRRASQGPKPEGLGGLSNFCSAGPCLLSVLT